MGSVLREIEEEDEIWENSRRSKPKHGRNLEATSDSPPVVGKAQVEKATPSVEETSAKKAPRGFY